MIAAVMLTRSRLGAREFASFEMRSENYPSESMARPENTALLPFGMEKR